MMEAILNIASWIFILAGSFFYIVGGIGLLRMPDVFTRMHAAGASDTMGAALLLIGMMLQAGISLVLAKLLMLLFFILFTGPVATHALARAGRYAGVEPVLVDDNKKKTKKRKSIAKKTPSATKKTVTTKSKKSAKTSGSKTDSARVTSSSAKAKSAKRKAKS